MGTVHDKTIKCAVVFGNGHYMFTGSSDHKLKLWDMKNQKLCHDFDEIHTAPVKCMVITPDEKKLLTAGYDCHLKLWSMKL